MAKKKQKTEAPEADEVRLWRDRIKASEKYRDRIASRYRWKEIVEEYKGQSGDIQNNTDIYVPDLNYVFAYIKTEIPSLYLRDPKLKVNPKNERSIRSAKILTKALNYLWRVNRYKRENKKNVLDVKLVGHSWFKSGYTGKSQVVEDQNQVFEFIDQENFFGYRVPFDKITFNQDALDPPYDCSWMAQEVWLPLDEVQGDSGYKNTSELEVSDPTDVEPDQQNTKNQDSDRAKEDPGSNKVKFYEIWDKVNKKILVISDQVDAYHKSPRAWPCEFKGMPYSFLELNDNPDSPYGIPDVFMFDSQIHELVKVRAMMLDHIKRFNRQLLGRRGALTDEAKSDFAMGRTGAYIEADIGPNESIGNVVTPIPYPNIQTDVYAIEARIKEDLINVSGQSATERGATQQTSTRTFRELAQMDKGAKNRRSEQIDSVEDFIEDIATNQIALLQQLADVPFYVRVTGEEEQDVIEGLKERPSAQKTGAITDDTGFTFTKEDIVGEFDIEVVAGSTAPLDSDMKMQRLLEILNLLPQLGAIPGGPVIATIGLGLAEELDMPEVVMAIKQEMQLAQQRQAQAEGDAKEAKQMEVANRSAELELEAQKVATKQAEAMIKALQVFKPEAPKAEKADKGPSESISFKDMPTEGKVQMAKQAGIHLTPEQVEAEVARQEEQKMREAETKAQHDKEKIETTAKNRPPAAKKPK
jgi:hypothetical protein